MRYIADTPYRSICVRSVIALTQPCVTLQTHHTEVSVSEVSAHLHLPGRGDIPYGGPRIPVRALQRGGV